MPLDGLEPLKVGVTESNSEATLSLEWLGVQAIFKRAEPNLSARLVTLLEKRSAIYPLSAQ